MAHATNCRHFPSVFGTTKKIKDDPTESLSSEIEAEPECLQDILPDAMPSFFQDKLNNICKHCECKQDVLWNNFRREEQHFDACFRYVNKEETPERKCFLKLYTLRVPLLSGSDLTISFSMVHHIRAEREEFVAASGDINNEDTNQEHMFGFLYGLDGKQMKTLLTSLVNRWQDIAGDHSKPSTGITPRLFVAALISQYGSIISERIRNVYKSLRTCDTDLQKAIRDLEKVKDLDLSSGQAKKIREINQNLIDMNIKLTGTKSMMHYLAESADVMVRYITPFEKYVEVRLDEWHTTSERARSKRKVEEFPETSPKLKKERTLTFNTKLLDALKELDSCSEQIRDHDKLIIVRKNMLQYKTDIESLQQHIKINVGMVSNVIAARDRAIQQSIMENTARDGAEMKFMAILTAFFLPGTFMAVFLTTPMFNFLDDAKPLLTKKGIPLAIYWGVTALGFVLLMIALILLHNRKKRRLELKAETSGKNDTSDGAAVQKGKSADKHTAKSGNQSPTWNGKNGKTTSTDGSSQGRSNPSPAWFRNETEQRNTDKLPAISGTAQELQPLIGGDYLGGVWSKDFRCGPLGSGDIGIHHQDAPYRSPSWSWAITDNKISFPGDWSTAKPFPETDIEIHLLEHIIVPQSKGNVYGKLQAAKITLSGHMIRFLRSMQVVGPFDNHGLVDSIGTCFFDKRTHEESIMNSSNPLFCAVTSDGEKYLRSVVRDDRIVEGVFSGDEEWVKAYEISKTVSQSFDQSFDAEECLALILHANEDDKDLYCLIVQAVHDVQYPCYRRVDILWIGGSSVDITWCKSWKIETLVLV